MVGDPECDDGAPGSASCSHPRVCCTSTSPKFSSQICQRHSSQSAARSAGGKKRSVHHRGSSRPMTTGASGENGKPVCPRVVRTVGRRFGVDVGAGAIAAEAWRSCAMREAYSSLGGVVVRLPGKRTMRGVCAKRRARLRNAFGLAGVSCARWTRWTESVALSTGLRF